CEDVDLRLLNKRVFESLVKAGALDSLAREHPVYASLPTAVVRPRLVAALESACEYGARAQRDREEGQAQLFSATFDAPAETEQAHGLTLPEVRPWSEAEQLACEKETLG